MENSLNKYKNNSQNEKQDKNQQPSTYGEYLKRKKLDLNNTISCTSQMQVLNTRSVNKTIQNYTGENTQNSSKDEKSQQPKTYGEYRRSKQLAMKMESSCSKTAICSSQMQNNSRVIKPINPISMQDQEKSQQPTTYGEYRRSRQIQSAQDFNTSNSHRSAKNNSREMKPNNPTDKQEQVKSQQPTTYGEYRRLKQTSQVQELNAMTANKSVQNSSGTIKPNNQAAAQAEEEWIQTSSHKRRVKNRQFSQVQDFSANTTNREMQNNSRESNRSTNAGQENSQQPSTYREYGRSKQLSMETSSCSKPDLNINYASSPRAIKLHYSIGMQNQELQQRSSTYGECHISKETTNDNATNCTPQTSDQNRSNVGERRSSENKQNVPRAPNIASSQQKDYINILRAVIDRSSADGSISMNNWEKIQEKLVEVFYQIVINETDVVPVVRDVGCFQGTYKLLSFGDRRSLKHFKETLSKLNELWPGANLGVVCIYDLPSRPTAVGWIPAKPENADGALQLLKDSNPHLPTDDWIFRKFGKVEGHRRKIVILINTKSLPHLEESACVISYAFGQVDLKIYRNEKDLWRGKIIQTDTPTDMQQRENANFGNESYKKIDEDLEYNSYNDQE